MPLNLNSLGPAGLAILNRWARDRENEHNQLRKQVTELQRVVHQLKTTNSNGV